MSGPARSVIEALRRRYTIERELGRGGMPVYLARGLRHNRKLEQALDLLEPLVHMPNSLSPGWLKIDPNFAPLRGNLRFERLVNGS